DFPDSYLSPTEQIYVAVFVNGSSTYGNNYNLNWIRLDPDFIATGDLDIDDVFELVSDLDEESVIGDTVALSAYLYDLDGTAATPDSVEWSIDGDSTFAETGVVEN